jgi:DNA-binding GntR family transcriptional regulator
MTQTRAETIAASLREAMRSGVYLCGERLTELTLARQMHVSQNTIRDALHQLEGEGWVNKRARHGVFVRSFTRDQVEELFELIGALEPLALSALFRESEKSSLIAALAVLLDGARKAAELGEWRRTVELLFQFHEMLAARTARPATSRLIAQCYNQVRLLEALRQARSPRNPRELEHTLQRHEALLGCVAHGHADPARALLAEQVAAYTQLMLSAPVWQAHA